MADRITMRDCATQVFRIHRALEDEAPDVRQPFPHHESGVWRLRWMALAPGTWESDIGPGFSTARELETYLRGIADGLEMVETTRHHVESDIRYLELRSEGRL